MNHDRESRKRLLDIVSNDSLGLFRVTHSNKKSQLDPNLIVERNLQEIIDFINENGRLPELNPDSINEYKLAQRLESSVADPSLTQMLIKLDISGALTNEMNLKREEIQLNKLVDRHNLLSGHEVNEIFELVNVKASPKLNPSNMSHRVRCLNFYEYENLFNIVHTDLVNSRRRLVEFDVAKLASGTFFVLSGVLGYVAKLELSDNLLTFSSGERIRTDGRTLCIFDNGTESRMLYRSLVKALQVDGFIISEDQEEPKGATQVSDGDLSMGYVYVLKTLHPKLKEYDDLFKIGFTSGLVSSRIANCEKEATYLFSRVKVAATYRCFNINASMVEDQLHKIFEPARLDLELKDSLGNSFKPREWFQVKIKDIDRAIQLVELDQISQFTFDPKYGFIEKSKK